MQAALRPVKMLRWLLFYIFYLSLSFELNTDWTLFQHCWNLYLHASIQNFNTRHSFAREKGR